MPEYLAPGVYVEEIERGPKPIEGVATNTAAFLGETERGPTKPKLVTSFNEYLRLFGDIYANDKFLPYAVKGFFDNGGKRCFIVRIVGSGATPAQLDDSGFIIKALGPGAAGNRIWVKIGQGTTKKPGDEAIGFKLQVAYWASLNPSDLFDPFIEENETLTPRPTIVEEFDDVSLDEDNPSSYDKRINNGNSALIEIESVGAGIPDIGAQLESGQDQNANPTSVNFQGDRDSNDVPIDDPSEFTGLAALNLDPYREVSIVHAPFPSDNNAVEKAIITHCKNNRFRFAVIDSESNLGAISQIDPRSTIEDSSYAAYYYPWLFIPDPRSGGRRKVPPGGAVCGIYSQTDNTRGVWKAPANVTVANTIDLEYDIDHRKQEVLNPRGVNVIRRFPGRGIRVWGARTLASDPLWKYVNVRRLFIFIEASIYNSTQWVVFEPNDHRLWARVKQTATLFLRTQWREGALLGASEEEAFSVAVGRGETMTEDDILNGRLIVEIGIAPVRPAEFVIFRVFQKTQEATS